MSDIGFACCSLCRFRARLCGDDPGEVRDSLRRILLAHLREHHPEERLSDSVRELLIEHAKGGAHG